MFLRAFVSLLLVVSTAVADTVSDGAIPYAERLIARMQAFDAKGIVSFTHTPTMERLGVTAEQVLEAAATMNANLQAAGGRYVSFELGTPTDSFRGVDGVYTLIPYSCVLDAKGKRIRQEAFFIAVSGDGGRTWKFLDGVMTNRIPIDAVVPGYEGPPLPLVRRVREE